MKHIKDPMGPKWIVHVDIEYYDGVQYVGHWEFEGEELEQALNKARRSLLRNEERMWVFHRLAAEMEKLETYNMTIEGARTYKRTWFNENYERELRERGL